ncbi:MAG: hypothetical protein CMH54_15770 [Myxococcales bacterium]|nr:hypothetical protein [Myxococcales bacterium]
MNVEIFVKGRRLKQSKVMMRRYFPILLLALGTFGAGLVVVPSAMAQEPQEIVDRMVEENRFGFDTGVAEVHLNVTDRNGYVKKQVLESKADKKGPGGMRRALITFLLPKDVTGTKFLSLESKDGQDEQWLYLPALRRKRRIRGAAKQGRFMGTDFSYADLDFGDLREGAVRKLPDGTLGKKKRPVWIIEVVPKAKTGGYSKIVMWVDQSFYLPLKIEFYDRAEKLQKILSVLKLKKRDGKPYASKIRMRNVQANTSTVMEVRSLQEQKDIPDNLFDPSLLAR